MDWKIIKIAVSLFVMILVPTYWRAYGPQNFLWLSDVGLFITLVALWTDSRLLMSVAALETGLFELIWNIDFFYTLIFGVSKIKLADYMFDSVYSTKLRLLSLFHMFMPLIWISYLHTYGYDKSAIYYAIPFFWLVLLLMYYFTDPYKNINWIFGPSLKNSKISQQKWLLIMFIGFPVFIFLPAHYLFLYLFY